MKTKIAGISAAALLAASLSAPASAAFVDGTIGFSGGLDTVSNIVSDLTMFDIGDPGFASGGTNDFAGTAGLTTTGNIDTLAPGGVIYSVGGFSFTLDSVSGISSTPISCVGNGQCTDSKQFNIAGTVSGNGFDASAFIGNFTSNGSCQEGAPGACEPGVASGTWSSTVVALPRPPVPVPATLALIGLGLAGLGWSRRSKA